VKLSGAESDPKIEAFMNSNNTNKRELVLYTLVGCHLCEQVAVMLREMGVESEAVEIDTDPELEQKYDIHIPVLFLPDSGSELFYPFGEEQVMEFLERRE
jgi:glutaredoxin